MELAEEWLVGEEMEAWDMFSMAHDLHSSNKKNKEIQSPLSLKGETD